MRIEEGKYYRNGLGEKIGPMALTVGRTYAFISGDRIYTAEGRYTTNGPCEWDLIAEWEEGQPWVDGPAYSTAYAEGNDFEMRRINGEWQHRILKRVPVVETVTYYYGPDGIGPKFINDTYCITFNNVDGVPDVSSVKMEAL